MAGPLVGSLQVTETANGTQGEAVGTRSECPKESEHCSEPLAQGELGAFHASQGVGKPGEPERVCALPECSASARSRAHLDSAGAGSALTEVRNRWRPSVSESQQGWGSVGSFGSCIFRRSSEKNRIGREWAQHGATRRNTASGGTDSHGTPDTACPPTRTGGENADHIHTTITPCHRPITEGQGRLPKLHDGYWPARRGRPDDGSKMRTMYRKRAHERFGDVQ